MKTHKQYIEELKRIEPNITVIGEYNGALNRIHVKCNLCRHEWFPIASSLVGNKNHQSKCPKCHSKVIEKSNSNLFANKYPDMAKWLKNSEDGFKYTFGSHVKVDWICPYCGSIVKNIPINKISSRKHVPCRVCSDGISYPNRLMKNVLMQLNEEHITEYSPDWIKPKRYDFYLPQKKIIIEMDGAIGHGNKTFDGSDSDEMHKIDKYKDEKALEHGIKVIRINSEISDLDYISSNIIKSDLREIFDLSSIDWNKCQSDSLTPMQIIVCNLWNDCHDIQSIIDETNLARTTVIKYLNSMSKIELCDYNPFKQHSLSGKNNISKAYEKNKIQVICLDTNQVFDSLAEANKWLGYNLKSHTIQDNCKGITKSAGKHPETKQKLHWMFFNDYQKLAEVI